MSTDHANLAGLLWMLPATSRSRWLSPIENKLHVRSAAGARGDSRLHGRQGREAGRSHRLFLDESADSIAAVFGAYAVGAIAVVINERFRRDRSSTW